MNEINKRLLNSSWDIEIASVVTGVKKRQRRNHLAAVFSFSLLFTGVLFFFSATRQFEGFYLNQQVAGTLNAVYGDQQNYYSYLEVEESIDTIIISELAYR
ncbi:MAG: hypothetical protein PF637_01645 [Spirochaetes bacterium]|jgi:hypothetical protein|nr:hypothetical protein [Spirochaetota bacterium]